jgi:hypothetical protein
LNNGGIYVESSFSAVNTTITGNYGHGIGVDYVDQGASLNNVTIAGNIGDGVSLNDAVSVSNTIVANNGGGGCTSPQGFVNSLGHNLDSDSTCDFNDQTDLHADPLLGPLQDNGGPTSTMLPGIGSMAIDAIDLPSCVETNDQRGVARPQGTGCDIGAVEVVRDILFADGFDGSQAAGERPSQATEHATHSAPERPPSTCESGQRVTRRLDTRIARASPVVHPAVVHRVSTSAVDKHACVLARLPRDGAIV